MTATRKRRLRRMLVKKLTLSVLFAAVPISAAAQAVLFHDGFARPNGLITDDYATFHPDGRGAKVDGDWVALSGSIFALHHAAWTGVPDDHIPQAGDIKPTSGTRSAQLRLVTRNASLGDVAVSFDLFNQGLAHGVKTPAKAFDGVHVLLRYQGDDVFYAVSVNRRDDTVCIKKKVQSGVYVDLTPSLPMKVRYRRWQHVTVAARNEADGSVTLQAYVDGKLVATAVDNGAGGPPLRGVGAVGLRGDNCEFLFGNFTVTALPSAGAAAPQALPVMVPGGDVPPQIQTKEG